jgi:hypothetical protein
MKGNRHPRVSYKCNTPAHLISSAGLHVAAALRALHRAQAHQEQPYRAATEDSAATTERLHTARAIAHLQEAHSNIKDAHAAHRRISPAL